MEKELKLIELNYYGLETEEKNRTKLEQEMAKVVLEKTVEINIAPKVEAISTTEADKIQLT